MKIILLYTAKFFLLISFLFLNFKLYAQVSTFAPLPSTCYNAGNIVLTSFVWPSGGTFTSSTATFLNVGGVWSIDISTSLPNIHTITYIASSPYSNSVQTIKIVDELTIVDNHSNYGPKIIMGGFGY